MTYWSTESNPKQAFRRNNLCDQLVDFRKYETLDHIFDWTILMIAFIKVAGGEKQRPEHRLTFLALWKPCWVASWCASSCASPRSWTRRWSVVTPCAGCVESSSAFTSTIHPAAVPCRGDPRIVSAWRQSARLPARRGSRGWKDQYMGCSWREKRVKRRRMRECGGGVESKHLLAVSWWDHWKLDFDEVEPLTLGGSKLRGVKAASSAFYPSSASSSPLIRNSFTLLARVLGAGDVVPMGSGGCDPSFPPRMSSETLFSTLENLPRAESYSLMLK